MDSSLWLNPSSFFRNRLKGGPQWSIAVGGPLLAAIGYGLSHAVLVNRAADQLQAVVPNNMEFLSGQIAWAASWSILGGVHYLLFWIVLSGMLVSLDLVWTARGDYERLFELTGLAFYTLLPYLLAALCIAWACDIPDLRQVEALHPREFAQVAQVYTIQVRQQPGFVWIIRLGWVFQGILILWTVLAYRAFAAISMKAALGIGLSLFAIFFLVGRWIDRC